MPDRFAVLEFVKSEREIPIKLKAIDGAPPQVFDWYVRRFNPFTLESIEILGHSGYRVRLPLTHANALRDKEKTELLTDLTLKSLCDYGVVILIPPTGYPYEFPKTINLATGKRLCTFFIADTIKRILSAAGRAAEKAEIAVIAGARIPTEFVIDCLYPHFNYISLILDDVNLSTWDEKLEDVYNSAGLNIGIYGNNREVLKNADVIINLSKERLRYIHNYKRSAAYFNLDENYENFIEVSSRRADIIAVKNLLLKCGRRVLNLETLELALYTGSMRYRLIYSNYERPTADEVKKLLTTVKLYRIDISHFRKNYIYF